MTGLQVQYDCPAPFCSWTVQSPYPFVDFAKVERSLRDHVDQHLVYRYVMRLRVWRFRRSLAARGDGKKA